MDKLTIKMLNPLSLAYMGDSILDTYVRKHIILKIKGKPNRLHQLSKQYVSAKGQAYALNILMENEFFTEEELEVIRKRRIQIYKRIEKVQQSKRSSVIYS